MSRELSRRDVVRKGRKGSGDTKSPICRAVRETVAELLYFWTRMHDSAASKIDRILHIKIVGHGNISVRESMCCSLQLNLPIPGVGFSAGQGMPQTSSCGQVPASSARAPAVSRSAKEATKSDLHVMVQ